jgi:uncharacterized protein (DUF3084 family)
MDVFSALFVLGLAVVSAIACFFADILGRRLGKSRVHFGRLRPRHTAAVIVSLVGFMIPMATILIVYLLSADVRVWLAEGRQAVWERDRKVLELRQKTKEYDELVEKSRAEAANLERAQSALSRANAVLETTRKDLAVAREAEARIRAQVAGLQRDRDRLQASVREMEAKAAALQKEFNTLSTSATQLVRQNQEYKDDILRLDRERRDTAKELDRVQKELQSGLASLKKAQNDLTAANELLAEAQANKVAAERELELARQQTDGERVKLAQLRQISNLLMQGLDVSRTRPMIYRIGDEIARLPVADRVDLSAAQNALTSLLRTVRLEAAQRGAQSPSPDKPVADLANLPQESGAQLTAEEQRQEIVRALATGDGPRVLIAYSLWNAFQGEPVPIQVRLFANPVVFRQGEVVAETRVDGRLSEEAILMALTEFLMGGVKAEALRRKMIPAAGQEVQIGEVKNEVILGLVREIKASGRVIRVQALAAADTRAADSLRLDFRLR